MGRELKRVPLDFDYPIGEIWKGYDASKSKDKIIFWKDYKGESICAECGRIYNDCSESHVYCLYHPDNQAIWKYDPPTGEGYQLWSTTTEGHPMSPVFETLEELCEWCAENETTFASFTATKDEWMKMLRDDFVCHQQGNVIFF